MFGGRGEGRMGEVGRERRKGSGDGMEEIDAISCTFFLNARISLAFLVVSSL